MEWSCYRWELEAWEDHPHQRDEQELGDRADLWGAAAEPCRWVRLEVPRQRGVSVVELF